MDRERHHAIIIGGTGWLDLCGRNPPDFFAQEWSGARETRSRLLPTGSPVPIARQTGQKVSAPRSFKDRATTKASPLRPGNGGARQGSATLKSAPKLNDDKPWAAGLTACNAPEVPENYLAGTLQSVSSVQLSPKVQRYILKFLSRMEVAVKEYRLGRKLLERHVASLPRTNDHSLESQRALSHFEQCAAALGQAAQMARPLTRKIPFLVSNDKSCPLYKLNKIYNRSKHLEGEERTTWIPPTPIWLTNDGLENSECTLKFVEMHRIILILATIAKIVVDELPNLIQRLRNETMACAHSSYPTTLSASESSVGIMEDWRYRDGTAAATGAGGFAKMLRLGRARPLSRS
jgi:hypothetical protein